MVEQYKLNPVADGVPSVKDAALRTISHRAMKRMIVDGQVFTFNSEEEIHAAIMSGSEARKFHAAVDKLQEQMNRALNDDEQKEAVKQAKDLKHQLLKHIAALELYRPMPQQTPTYYLCR